MSASGLVYKRRLVALSYASLASFCTTAFTLLYPQTISLSLLLLSAMKVFSANFSRLCLYLSASLVVSGAVAKPARILKRSSVARRSVTSAGRPLTQFNIRENRLGLSRIRRQGPSPAFNAVVPEATGTTPDSGGDAFPFASQNELERITLSAVVSSLNADGNGAAFNTGGLSSLINGANRIDLNFPDFSSPSGVSENVSVEPVTSANGVPNLGSSSASTSISDISRLVNLSTGAPPTSNSPATVASAAGTGGVPTANNDSVSANLTDVSGIPISSATGPSGAAPTAAGASGSIGTMGAGTGVRPSASSDLPPVKADAGTNVFTASGNNPGANAATATIPSGAAMPNGVAASVNTPGAEMGVEPSVNGSMPSAVAASAPPAGGNNLGPDLATVPGNVTPAATTLSGHGAASINTAGAGTGNPTANGDIGNVMVPPANIGSGVGIPNPNANGDFVSATVSGAPIAVPSVNGNPNSANADSQPASGAPINVLSGDPNFGLVSIDASGSPAVNADTPSASLSGTGNGPAVNGGTPSASSSASGNGLPVGGSNTSATANAQGSEPSFLTAPDADVALTTSTLGTTRGATTDTDDAVTATEELGMNVANVANDDVDIDAQDDTAHVAIGSNKVGEVVE